MPLVQVRYKHPATKETQELLKGLDPSFMRWNNRSTSEARSARFLIDMLKDTSFPEIFGYRILKIIMISYYMGLHTVYRYMIFSYT